MMAGLTKGRLDDFAANQYGAPRLSPERDMDSYAGMKTESGAKEPATLRRESSNVSIRSDYSAFSNFGALGASLQFGAKRKKQKEKEAEMARQDELNAEELEQFCYDVVKRVQFNAQRTTKTLKQKVDKVGQSVQVDYDETADIEEPDLSVIRDFEKRLPGGEVTAKTQPELDREMVDGMTRLEVMADTRQER